MRKFYREQYEIEPLFFEKLVSADISSRIILILLKQGEDMYMIFLNTMRNTIG